MRVLLSVPIVVAGKDKDGKDFSEDTRTLVVNAHGALISLATPVVAGQEVMIANKATRKSLECRIVYLGNAQDNKTQMGIEFIAPSATFWRSISRPTIGLCRRAGIVCFRADARSTSRLAAAPPECFQMAVAPEIVPASAPHCWPARFRT